MTELIATIILLASLSGIIAILSRKIPVLIEMPLQEEEGVSLFEKTKKNLKKLIFVQSFSFENFLEKLLRRSKVLTLKTENKISGWLENLHQKSEKNSNGSEDKYWQNIQALMRSGSPRPSDVPPKRRGETKEPDDKELKK